MMFTASSIPPLHDALSVNQHADGCMLQPTQACYIPSPQSKDDKNALVGKMILSYICRITGRSNDVYQGLKFQAWVRLLNSTQHFFASSIRLACQVIPS